MEFLIYGIIICFSFITGVLFNGWFTDRFKHYTGTIFVQREDEKIVYSLELNDDPETIQFKDEVLFKVDASEENLDRD